MKKRLLVYLLLPVLLLVALVGCSNDDDWPPFPHSYFLNYYPYEEGDTVCYVSRPGDTVRYVVLEKSYRYLPHTNAKDDDLEDLDDATHDVSNATEEMAYLGVNLLDLTLGQQTDFTMIVVGDRGAFSCHFNGLKPKNHMMAIFINRALQYPEATDISILDIYLTDTIDLFDGVCDAQVVNGKGVVWYESYDRKKTYKLVE